MDVLAYDDPGLDALLGTYFESKKFMRLASACLLGVISYCQSFWISSSASSKIHKQRSTATLIPFSRLAALAPIATVTSAPSPTSAVYFVQA